MRLAPAKPTPPHHVATHSPHDATDRDVRFLRFPAVRARTGLSRSTIWRLERHGGFPRHRRISPNAVAWVEQEVIDWMRAKVEAGA
jgi:prophage regulatory protein